MIQTKKYLSVNFIFTLLFIYSCSGDPLDIKVPELETNIKTIRLDEAVFNANWKGGENQYALLNDKYGEYMDFYSGFILNNPMGLTTGESNRALKQFATDPIMREFFSESQLLFKGEKFDPYLAEIQSAFSYFNHYFPEDPIPSIVLYQSGFNYKIVPNDTLIGIGVEWYLGAEHNLVKKLSNQAFPQYEKNKMKAEFLTVDAIKGFLKVKYQDMMEMDNFLSVIIFYGKIQYITDALMHDKDDAVKMNYSKEEYEWLQKNEKEVWTFMAETNLLFENDLRLISQWVNDGPFTNGLPQESPSRVGIYVGWQIVKQYMQKYPDKSLKSLLRDTNYNAFLSAYKPK